MKRDLPLPETPIKKVKLQNLDRTPISKISSAFKRSSTPQRLIGREMERKEICGFLESRLDKKLPGSMYISGCPGTGKTALVREICKNRPHHYLNCMEIAPKQIYGRILKLIGSTKDDIKSLEKEVFGSGEMIFLILDEIDSLMTKDQDILYTLFEWCKLKGSRLVVIGIANALDLTSRFLPRLKTKNYEPKYLSFAPYKVEEISAIIKDRLAGFEPGTPLTPSKTSQLPMTPSKPMMQPMAIELTARKLAGTGDLRKALDICRQAISMVEADENPQVTVKHILKATSSMFGSSSKERMKELQLIPKVILVILALLDKPVQYKLVYDAYKAYFKSEGISAITSSEFQDLVSQLDGLGLLVINKRKKDKVLSLNNGVADILDACKGQTVIDNLISKGLPKGPWQ